HLASLHLLASLTFLSLRLHSHGTTLWGCATSSVAEEKPAGAPYLFLFLFLSYYFTTLCEFPCVP
ncbi:hypothetical protein HPG69_001477, partial [Diceros bicornis minor]